jgi:hypothetical protein
MHAQNLCKAIQTSLPTYRMKQGNYLTYTYSHHKIHNRTGIYRDLSIKKRTIQKHMQLYIYIYIYIPSQHASAGAMMAEARQFDAGVPTVGQLWSSKRRHSVGS